MASARSSPVGRATVIRAMTTSSGSASANPCAYAAAVSRTPTDAPEVEVLQPAGVPNRAREGSGQAHPCISLNVVTESKEFGAVTQNRLALGSLTTRVPEHPRKKSARRYRIGASVFVAG